jgi:ribosomal protein S18 acetylase RimI-like enzyme
MPIKLVSPDQIKIIQDLAHLIWPETFKEILSPEQIQYMLEWMYNIKTLKDQAEKGHEFYIYSENGKALGFIGLEAYSEQNKLKIHKIYVLPDIQGKGVGKKLLLKAIEIVKEKGISNVFLNVNRYNNAVGFYKKFGFEILYEENIDIGNGYLMEDYVMNLELQ